MKPIPLEDTFADVLSKARRGLGLDLFSVAQRAGVPEDRAAAVLDGEFDEEIVRALSPELGLCANRTAALGRGDYVPAPVSLPGLESYNTPFHDMMVNSYLVWDKASGKAVAFDTGTDIDDMLAALKAKNLTLDLILLTHSHGDHIYELDRLVEKTGATAWIGDREPVAGASTFAAGRVFEVGGLRIDSRLTWGHSPGGITYVVTGLDRPLAVVGDAIFAGSMGGGGVSYSDALRTNQEEILSLPDETIICPGHGPLTTVGEQKQNNPFFP